MKFSEYKQRIDAVVSEDWKSYENIVDEASCDAELTHNDCREVAAYMTVVAATAWFRTIPRQIREIGSSLLELADTMDYMEERRDVLTAYAQAGASCSRRL